MKHVTLFEEHINEAAPDWDNYTNDIDREFVKEMRKQGYDGVFDKSQSEVVVYDANNIWTIRD